MNNSTSPVTTPPTEKPRRRRYQTAKRSTMPPLRLAETPTVPTPKQRRRLPLMAWGAYWLSFLAFSSTTTILVGGVWVGVQLMYDPKAVAWLQPFLRPWLQMPFASSGPPQTMAEIRAALTTAGLIPGEVLDLDPLSRSLAAAADVKTEEMQAESQSYSHFLLFPVMGPCEATTGSQDACTQIVELRVYQQVRSPEDPDTSLPYYQMTAQLPLTGPAESFAISPITDGSSPRLGSNRPLPLTKIEPFSPTKAPATGIWFNASGQMREGHLNLTYGLAIHYNLNTNHLSVMEHWTSPGGNQPYWQEVTGGEYPELVVEQTYGMEPHFLIYQVKPQKFVLNPIILEAISLNQPAADNRVYKDALLLAQEGLWSPAWDLMTSARGQMGNNWLSGAQAQLDLIRFHAQATQIQAKEAGKTPTQQVRTALLDGRWQQALSLFEAHLKAGNDLTPLFSNDVDPLWNRLETALKVNPRLVEARVWGALTIAATESQENADAWLSQQLPLGAKDQERLRSLLDKQQQAMTIADRLKRHRSQIVGTAVVLNQVNPQDWLQPEISQALEIKPNDIWYQVEVAGYHDSQTWRQPPYRDLSLPEVAPINYLWKQLGLHNNPQIQISIPLPDGKEQITTATVKGLQLKGGAIQLLAAGIAPSTPANGKLLFTTTESTLEWLQTTPLTLAELNQQQPQFSAKILPLLWLELQAAGELSPRQVPNPSEIPKPAENWLVELIDLTGNGQPETIITFPATPNSRRRILIFDDIGNLIYSEFTTASDQSAIGIANVRDGGLPALVVEGITDYTLQRWSSERQRFEF